MRLAVSDVCSDSYPSIQHIMWELFYSRTVLFGCNEIHGTCNSHKILSLASEEPDSLPDLISMDAIASASRRTMKKELHVILSLTLR